MFHYQPLEIPEGIPFRTEVLSLIASTLSEHIEPEWNGILNIAFLPDEEVQRLNREHRGIDKNTDVLSFHYFEDFEGVSKDEIAGEIILSESKLRSQAEEYHETLEAEFAKLVIHSSLHILGYDHEDDEDYQEMREAEKIIEDTLQKTLAIEIRE